MAGAMHHTIFVGTAHRTAHRTRSSYCCGPACGTSSMLLLCVSGCCSAVLPVPVCLEGCNMNTQKPNRISQLPQDLRTRTRYVYGRSSTHVPSCALRTLWQQTQGHSNAAASRNYFGLKILKCHFCEDSRFEAK